MNAARAKQVLAALENAATYVRSSRADLEKTIADADSKNLLLLALGILDRELEIAIATMKAEALEGET